MPLSDKIRNLKSREIIAELQGYGLNVIGQEHIPCTKIEIAVANIKNFFEQYGVNHPPIVVWLSQAAFREEIATRRAQGNVDIGLCLRCGWVHFAARPAHSLQDCTPVGELMAQRLRTDRAVTLTPLTAAALMIEWSRNPPHYCAYVLRWTLWLLLRYVLSTRRPTMIAVHRGERRARLWHLRVESVAAFFPPPEQSWRPKRSWWAAIAKHL